MHVQDSRDRARMWVQGFLRHALQYSPHILDACRSSRNVETKAACALGPTSRKQLIWYHGKRSMTLARSSLQHLVSGLACACGLLPQHLRDDKKTYSMGFWIQSRLLIKLRMCHFPCKTRRVRQRTTTHMFNALIARRRGFRY